MSTSAGRVPLYGRGVHPPAFRFADDEGAWRVDKPRVAYEWSQQPRVIR